MQQAEFQDFSLYFNQLLFYFAVDLSPMFPDTLMVGMEIRLKVGVPLPGEEIQQAKNNWRSVGGRGHSTSNC